jgi:hypothetical protein
MLTKVLNVAVSDTTKDDNCDLSGTKLFSQTLNK